MIAGSTGEPVTVTVVPSRLWLIAAVARNGVIGRDGRLPWRLRTDLRRFRRLTLGHPVIMGRKTWDAIGGPLPGRRSVVVSRRCGLVLAGAEVATSLEEALAVVAGDPEAFCIGGAQLYAEALPCCARIYLTWVEAEVAGDVHFPVVEWSDWQALSEKRVPAGDLDEHPTTFVVYERRPPPKSQQQLQSPMSAPQPEAEGLRRGRDLVDTPSTRFLYSPIPSSQPPPRRNSPFASVGGWDRS